LNSYLTIGNSNIKQKCPYNDIIPSTFARSQIWQMRDVQKESFWAKQLIASFSFHVYTKSSSSSSKCFIENQPTNRSRKHLIKVKLSFSSSVSWWVALLWVKKNWS